MPEVPTEKTEKKPRGKNGGYRPGSGQALRKERDGNGTPGVLAMPRSEASATRQSGLNRAGKRDDLLLSAVCNMFSAVNVGPRQCNFLHLDQPGAEE